MKLTQALLPASKVQDGPDSSITSSPDNHGGFEFGTWETKHPWDFLGIKYNIRLAGKCSYGVQCCHKFTTEECKQIVEHLKTYKKISESKKAAFGLYDDNGKLVDGHYAKWHQRLVDLFSNENDPPVYYWAD